MGPFERVYRDAELGQVSESWNISAIEAYRTELYTSIHFYSGMAYQMCIRSRERVELNCAPRARHPCPHLPAPISHDAVRPLPMLGQPSHPLQNFLNNIRDYPIW
jgi:hypothetical protein